MITARMEGKTMSVPLTIRVSPELKEAVGQASDAANRPMNEVVAEILAAHFGKPELADIPRLPLGRPRTRKNGSNGHGKRPIGASK
jgi:hypothetical protein